ncbi:MAG TPA: hypothetical protein VGJ14_09290 [Sporichthyaceae bacterium]|jgi:hypothetical protein
MTVVAQIPFEIVTDPSFDLPAAPQFEVPLWSETYLWCCWDPERRIGVYFHQGTAFFDQSIWRNTMTVCLPDGRMIETKHYGRPSGGTTNGCEALGVVFDEPLQKWTVRLNGACQIVTREANRTRLHTDGPPRGAKVELTFTAKNELLNHGVVSWGKLHHNQHCSVAGRIEVDGEVYEFSGPGYRDHSRGPRDLTGYIGSDFVWAQFPSGTTLIAADIFMKQEGWGKAYGLMNRDGVYTPFDIVSMPDLTLCASDPGAVLFSIDEGNGNGPVEITGRIEQAINFTHKLPGTELCLGTELTTNSPTDMVVLDCWTTYEWNGEVGYGLCEWITPINQPRPGKSAIPRLLDIPLFTW